MPSRVRLFVTAMAMGLMAASLGKAQDANPQNAVDEVLVLARDRAGLLEKQPSTTVFGLEKPLLETPRSASFVSDTMLQRFGVETLDGLTAVSPGTYTASFYGVPGALNIRGTLAENYFRGFKRVENRGTYATPIGGAAQIEIVRGPPTPLYGAGKVGGMLNFIPKSARDEGRFLTDPRGELTATVGAYDKKNLTGQIALPVKLGAADGGVYAYGEVDDSKSFYRGLHPKRQLAEVSADFDLGGGWSTAFGGMVYHSTGDVQTPGWNRLTQDLIDHQTYVTGRDTTLVDADGNGRLTPGEVGFYPFGSALYIAYGAVPKSDPNHTLDTGVGTTRLSPRTVHISPADFSTTRTNTLYLDLAKRFDDGGVLKLQLFYDDQENRRFVSYGYPAWFDSAVWEARASYAFERDFGAVSTQSIVGASFRRFEGRRRESFNSGMIAIDRRDIAFGATPTDIIDSPFSTEPADVQGLQWENDNSSTWRQAGLFFTSDVKLDHLTLTLGGRYDDYDVAANDTGFLPFTVPGRQTDSRGKATYSASLTYQTPIGLMPYVSYAKASALEVSQAGDLAPGLVADGSWLSSGDLAEAGVKVQLLHGTLVGSLAGYRQNRTQLSGLTPIVQSTRAKGVEVEVRWLASNHLSFTATGNAQHTTVEGPDTSFQYIPAYTAGVPAAQAYGGSYVIWSFGGPSGLPGRAGDYDYSLIPNSVVSLYAAYTSDVHDWGSAGATLGVTHVSKTSGTVQDAVTYPAYAVVNASAYLSHGPYTAELNVENLFDTLYFTPDADTYANLGALPGKGREWRVTLKRTF
ncbi:TonB-dependent siderophore receptor [Caulobacter sp. DWP3-1-3b2]|uniref:TonB-dependent siderophore receptor n=1 Tax=Caulobacter sp. DWP3-1-3b2 TaxID=2804643 RepID=UPI003CE8B58A